MEKANRYAKLVDMLWTKSTEDKIPWSFNEDRAVVYVWGGDSLLEIGTRSNENFETDYLITLYNRSGIIMESFADTELGIPPTDSFDSYYRKMEALYDLSRRQATGADKALDSFIGLLEEDKLDPPF